MYFGKVGIFDGGAELGVLGWEAPWLGVVGCRLGSGLGGGLLTDFLGTYITIKADIYLRTLTLWKEEFKNGSKKLTSVTWNCQLLT